MLILGKSRSPALVKESTNPFHNPLQVSFLIKVPQNGYTVVSCGWCTAVGASANPFDVVCVLYTHSSRTSLFTLHSTRCVRASRDSMLSAFMDRYTGFGP